MPSMIGSKLALAAGISLTLLQYQPAAADFQDCRGKLSPNDRTRCEEVFARQVQAASRTSELPGGWRLVRTRDPRGGPEAISVLHTANTAKSDLGFAGLSFRCSPKGIETLLILLAPLARGAGYAVAVKSGTAEAHFEAQAIQGGEVLLLPPSASGLAGGPWQESSELSFDIAAPSPIRGSVAIGGLSGALSILSQSCPPR